MERPAARRATASNLARCAGGGHHDHVPIYGSRCRCGPYADAFAGPGRRPAAHASGGSAAAREMRRDSGGKARPLLDLHRGRPCRVRAFALRYASASVAGDTEKGDAMSLRKRGGLWWVDVVAPNGERVRQSTGTASKALAQEFHDRYKSELWRIAKLGEKPRRTWNDAVVRWLKEKSHKATIKGDVNLLRWLDPFLGGKDLATITRATLDHVTDEKLARGCSNATVNRTMALVRAILRICVNEWEWLDRVPQVRMLRVPTRRIRFLTHDEARRLLTELPEHLADMAAFSLATGLRAANVTGLQWQQVDLTRQLAWIHPDQAKARRAIPVPLNGVAVALVQKWVGRHSTYVFSFHGKPINQVSTKAWYQALKRAGIEDFRWHDLRHYWASWHVQNGTPLFALQELGGWQSAAMVRRYAHLAADHLTPYAQRLRAVRAVEAENHGTFTAQ